MQTITEQQARLWCLILSSCTGLVFAVIYIPINLTTALGSLVAAILMGGLAFLYWRGWQPACLIAIGLAMITVVTLSDVSNIFMSVMLTTIIALLLANGWGVLLVGIITTVFAIGQQLLLGGRLDVIPVNALPTMALLITLMSLTRIILENERQKSQGLALEARTAQLQSEAQATELAQQTQILTVKNDEQQRLIELVAKLEAPAIPLAEGLLLVPLVGHIDSRRAAEVTKRLLQLVNQQQIKMVVLDLSGVPIIDSTVAKSLLSMIQMLRLLGCQVTLSGIAASVASTIAQLGVNFGDARVVRSPQEAIESFMALRM